MKPPDEVSQELVQDWLEKADEDYGVAEFLVSSASAFYAIAAFHAQQAAEKYLKALLIVRQVRFPRTHDLVELLDLVAEVDPMLADALESCATLNPFGVEVRYPGDAPAVTLDEARSAVEVARLVRNMIREQLT